MSQAFGTDAQPLRVAIIGSGPSAFYAADHLLKQSDPIVAIDMFERLPTPYGLVRGGVAPDHQKIKSVTKVYDRTAAHPRFRFYGHVEFGTDLTIDDVRGHYHALILAVGAQSDRKMGIPGEDLPGSHAATEFVGWYNAHPDYRNLTFDVQQTAAAVIGNGNVAMDVARILASSYDELAATDIADYALDALRHSAITDIYVFGRRGPAQAAFTNPELKELGELAIADVIVRPEDAALDPLTAAALLANPDTAAQKNVDLLARYAQTPPAGKARRIHMRFLESPVQLLGTDRVEAIEIVANELVQSADGSLRPRATDRTTIVPVGLVLRSIGYKGVGLPGLPFDARNGILPNDQGRVLAGDAPLVGVYCVGWIKRGPSGVIGTNKPDSQESAELLLADARAGALTPPAQPQPDAIDALLTERGIEFVTYADWQHLDSFEQARGSALGRPRVKLSSIDDMLNLVREHRGIAPGG